MSFPLKALGDITINKDGQRIPLNQSERDAKRGEGRYPYIGANNVVDRIDEYLFDEEILCVAEDGGSWGPNDICALLYNEKCWVNNHAHVLTAKEGTDLRYLCYYLNHADLNALINGTTRGKLNKSVLNQIQVPLPPLPTQRHIAAVLDKAQALVANDKHTLALYDQLAKSLFLEMFGDLASNPKGWKAKRMVDLCADTNDVKCGPFGTQLQNRDYKEEGVPLWGIKQINSSFTIPTAEFLTPAKAKELSSYSIIPDDIVMSRKGNVGKCALYPKDLEPGIMHSDVLRIRVSPSVANAVFISHQLRYSRAIEHQIGLVSSGAIMAGVNVTKLKSIEVHVPPLTIQLQYENALEALDRQRATAETSLRRSEGLFGSLLQGAFSGGFGGGEGHSG